MSGQRILLVGSSFSNGIAPYLKYLITSSGNESPVIDARVVNSWTLELHATSTKTQTIISTGAYDFVVLQEESDAAVDSNYLYNWGYPSIRALNTRINNAGGSTVLAMTWKDKGSLLSTYDALKGTVGDTDGPGSVPIAFELDLPIAPTGWMFRTAIAQNSAINLWKFDGHHANERGRYFAAMCIFCAIYQTSPVGLYCPTATKTTKTYDQALANSVVLGANKTVWNIH